MNEQTPDPAHEAGARAAQAAPETDAHAPQTPEDQSPETRIAQLETALGEMRDRWMRAEADMQNLRARTQKELADTRAYATQKFATDVVEAAENLRRGLDSLPAPAKDEPELLTKLRGGFEGVEKAFLAMLERNGVTRVEALGQPFDPDLHQAMAEQPAPPGVAPGTVMQAWTGAWTLRGRLLKPAMVVVAK